MSNAASGLAHLKPFLPGLGPLLEDAEVSEIMINGPGNVWIEARGRLTAHAAPGLDESALLRAAIHIARPLGLDPATTPIIDARLDDGSRVAICVPPASPHVAITIRRFGKRTFSAADLVEQKALPENVLEAAEQVLMTRRNILVSGGTGSGKTTLLNALIELLPVDERIVAIEDTLELRIDHSNCVRFEARGLQEGAVTIRDLVRHALRHRPDHIVVGEVRGGEAADLLQALNTGHGGSLTTVHANNAESALSRIASCAMQGGGELPWEVTCRGVVDGIAMVIHMTRREGRRFVEEAAYVKGYEAGENRWVIQPVWPPSGSSSTSGRGFAGREELVKVLRESSPQALHHFTRFDQVDQLVRASEAAPDTGFMARLMMLCSLPRTNPGTQLQYKRVNGPYTLIMTAVGQTGLPYGNLSRLLLAWVCTEAVRTQSRELFLGASLSGFMRRLCMAPIGGGSRGDRTRLRDQMRRLFNAHIQLAYEDKQVSASVNSPVASRTGFWWNERKTSDRLEWDNTIELGEKFFNEIIHHPVPLT